MSLLVHKTTVQPGKVTKHGCLLNEEWVKTRQKQINVHINYRYSDLTEIHTIIMPPNISINVFLLLRICTDQDEQHH